MECSMAEYGVFAGRLFRAGGEQTTSAELGRDGCLVLSRHRRAEPVALTAEVAAYTYCEACRPVLYLRDTASAWGDYVQERRPWCEWRLVFVGGALTRAQAIRFEMLAEALAKEGLEVLDDGDRLARLHFARLDRDET